MRSPGDAPIKAISVSDIASTDMRSERARYDEYLDGSNPVAEQPKRSKRSTGKWVLGCKSFRHESMGPFFACRFASKREGAKWAHAIPNWQMRIYAMNEPKKRAAIAKGATEKAAHNYAYGSYYSGRSGDSGDLIFISLIIGALCTYQMGLFAPDIAAMAAPGFIAIGEGTQDLFAAFGEHAGSLSSTLDLGGMGGMGGLGDIGGISGLEGGGDCGECGECMEGFCRVFDNVGACIPS